MSHGPSQGASPHGPGLGESQGKVRQARGKSGPCQGQPRGKSGAPWRLNPKAPSSPPPPMVPGAGTQVVSPESQATVHTCPIDHAWGVYMGAMVRGRVSVGPWGTPGCLELCSHILFPQSHWPPLGSGKLCTGIVLCTLFVLTHVDGVATQEGEGRVSEPWGKSGASPHWAGARGKSGESHTGQGKVRGMPGASQGKVRGTLAPKP